MTEPLQENRSKQGVGFQIGATAATGTEKECREDALRGVSVARDKRIFELWLACWTQEEVAEQVGCPRETARDLVATFGENPQVRDSAKVAASYLTDFDPPLYNVWKQQEKTAGASRRSNTATTEAVSTILKKTRTVALEGQIKVQICTLIL